MKKVLIIHNSGLGNSVLLYPLLYSLQRQDFKINIIIKNSQSFEYLNLLPGSKKQLLVKRTHIFTHLLMLIFFRIKNSKFDILINTNLEYKIKKIFSYDYFIHKIFNFDKLIYPETNKNIYEISEINIYKKLLTGLNLNFFTPKIPYLYSIKINKNLKKKFIGVSFGSSIFQKWKRLPIEKIIQLIELLSQDFNVKFFYGPEDSDLAIKVINAKNFKKINFIKPKNIKSLIQNMNDCFSFLGSDNGLIHIAGSLNINTFTIFGPTSSIKNININTKNISIYEDFCDQRLNTLCDNCKKDYYERNIPPRCLTSINIDKIYNEKIKKRLFDSFKSYSS